MDYYGIEEDCYSQIDEINFEVMDDHIKELWDKVMIPYLRNINHRQILDKLNEYDYDKFYRFMRKCVQIKYTSYKSNSTYGVRG